MTEESSESQALGPQGPLVNTEDRDINILWNDINILWNDDGEKKEKAAVQNRFPRY